MLQASSALKRPSAVVTNEAGDIFIKDDRQVHAFDKEGIFIRSFGYRHLQRPYGGCTSCIQRKHELHRSAWQSQVGIYMYCFVSHGLGRVECSKFACLLALVSTVQVKSINVL